MTPALALPPWTETEDGTPRRVGVEIEMNGLDLDTVAGIVADFLGLPVSRDGRYERRIEGDTAGNWVVELDFSLLKRMGRETRDPDTLGGELGRSAEEAVALVSELWVPVELVSPPLPLDRLGEVEVLIARLHEAGAKGTADRVLNAFGMQLNPEVATTDAAHMTSMLRSFLCLHDWIVARRPVNLSRRMTTFIDPFPKAYVRHVVDPAYAPDRARLIDDYLRWNPTRNRALDCLPLFAHLDPDRVTAAVEDDRIKPRPTFHYRLPDSEIDDPSWGLAGPWADWVAVERLAADGDRLAACAAAYAAFLARPVERWLGDWPAEVEARWLAR